LYRSKEIGNPNVHYMALRIFDSFDRDGDGYLNFDEMYALKAAAGTRSYGRIWSTTEHEFLCNAKGLDPSVGLPCHGVSMMYETDPEGLRRDFESIGLQ
jgi:hypothetical protein